MLTLAIQAGLRDSELIGVNCNDIRLDTGAHVSHWKGANHGPFTFTKDGRAALAVWRGERAGRSPSERC